MATWSGSMINRIIYYFNAFSFPVEDTKNLYKPDATINP